MLSYRILQEFADVVNSNEKHQIALKDTLDVLMTTASEEGLYLGAEIVKNKNSMANQRWVELKAACATQYQNIDNLRIIFLHFEEEMESVTNVLGQIEDSRDIRVSHGADMRKVGEEIQRIEVGISVKKLLIAHFTFDFTSYLPRF